jgi:hypothetical protein
VLRKPGGNIPEFGCSGSEVEFRTVDLNAEMRAVETVKSKKMHIKCYLFSMKTSRFPL